MINIIATNFGCWWLPLILEILALLLHLQVQVVPKQTKIKQRFGDISYSYCWQECVNVWLTSGPDFPGGPSGPRWPGSPCKGAKLCLNFSGLWVNLISISGAGTFLPFVLDLQHLRESPDLQLDPEQPHQKKLFSCFKLNLELEFLTKQLCLN